MLWQFRVFLQNLSSRKINLLQVIPNARGKFSKSLNKLMKVKQTCGSPWNLRNVLESGIFIMLRIDASLKTSIKRLKEHDGEWSCLSRKRFAYISSRIHIYIKSTVNQSQENFLSFFLFEFLRRITQNTRWMNNKFSEKSKWKIPGMNSRYLSLSKNPLSYKCTWIQSKRGKKDFAELLECSV